ncbi:CocE/NonD family hydrolase [Rhodovulum sp. 12E13]|uniref:CocE/NonD family hydrolase n=1 Tax=Rhodovulum sp. 12E13 TaxID=2203891 RepID=UPI000E15262C|nr:CocE/NonD family hydrolase [Rhodovulum sp. 12E13]RDC74952.1 CocE/NonD family hydrolase [Rhodovulum sp. 12E13]
MKIVDTFPHAVREISHTEVPMPDGTRLAARIWMPEGAEGAPVPAILEYLPYRKNDFTAARDATMQPYLAGHGYAVVRLDLRGAGDSEGIMPDEYLPQELQDGVDAIAWIAAQPWCDGNIGMIGISWGGFNGLQVAALQPPALKAIVTLCSTDDRYADDVHYMGGCLLGEQLSWASIMFGRNSLPPDPANVGDRWREMWMGRLEGSGLWLKNWLAHQTRDAFWKHGSICEDWSAIRIPVYAVSGWPDGYCRAVFRLMENLQGPRKGLVGPWAHRYPHIGEPGPAIGFLQEELRWWDHWLKGRETGIMDEPMLRLYRMNSAEPAGHYEHREGEWIAEPSWPSPNVRPAEFYLAADRSLAPRNGGPHGVCEHSSPPDVGMASGKWCGYSKPGDAPLDKRRDDAGSLTFETTPLDEALDIAGDAQVLLDLEADRPVAQLAVRISDVHPDGRATRVTFGVLNLTHRDGHEHPEPLEPGRRTTIRVPMKHVAQRFRPGHRLRLAISTNYFPMIWPAPERVTIRVHTEASRLILPVRAPAPEDAALRPFEEAEGAPPLAKDVLEEPEEYWEIVEDARTGAMEMRLADGGGRVHFHDNDLVTYSQGTESYRIGPAELTSATGRTRWRYEMARGDWHVSTETETMLTADATDFIVQARLRAWEGETLVHEQEWDERIPRMLV